MSRAVGYAVTAGLRVPWLRDAVTTALRVRFTTAGRNQSHDDPALRAALYAESER